MPLALQYHTTVITYSYWPALTGLTNTVMCSLTKTLTRPGTIGLTYSIRGLVLHVYKL